MLDKIVHGVIYCRICRNVLKADKPEHSKRHDKSNCAGDKRIDDIQVDFQSQCNSLNGSRISAASATRE